MKTKQELELQIDEIVMRSLKQDFAFFYNHLRLLARPKLEASLKDSISDNINDAVNDGLHHEQMDEYHSSVSTSLDFDEVKKFMDEHESALGLVAEIYADEA